MARTNQKKALRYLTEAGYVVARLGRSFESLKEKMAAPPELVPHAYEHEELGHITQVLKDLEEKLGPIMKNWERLRPSEGSEGQ